MTNAGPAIAHFQMFSLTPQGEVRWRLLSANNRDLGRGVAAYPDAGACQVAIKELVVELDALQAQVRRRGPSQWQWALLAGADVVVLGAHGYDRQVRCDQAVRHFVEHAALGQIADTLVLAGARRWTSASASQRPLAVGPIRGRLGRGADA